MSLILHGIGVSRGIAIGRVQVLHRNAVDVIRTQIPQKETTAEIQRFEKAWEKAHNHLHDIRKSIENKFSYEVVSFIDSHLLMLGDDLLHDGVITIIKTLGCNAEWALQQQENQLIAAFDQMSDDYLKTRKDDVKHVIRLIQRFLLGDEESIAVHQSKYSRGSIIVADDLTPADTILLQNQSIAGFVTELGGPTSHTSILARGLDIPAVVAVHNARTLILEAEEIILDGGSGMIAVETDTKTIKKYRRLQRESKRHQMQLLKLGDRKTTTKDGVDIALMANLELPEEIKTLKKIKAEGIGLYRTEFLYLNRESAAEEEEQYRVYRHLIKAMEGKPVTIRTLDLGAEKEFDPEYKAPLAVNPALGLRALRRSLKEPETFLHQLRAILRASVYGNVRLMLPMLTSLQEIHNVKQLISTAQRQLQRQKKTFSDKLQIGGMIEVPAAALSARRFAEHLDFLSIGTNDLIQYTLAIDRIDDEVNYLYDPLHPSVLKLISMVIQAGKQADIPVAMCGEMAGDPAYTRLLLGMGLMEFSAHLATLLEVKEVILASNITKLKRKCARILSADPDKIAHLVRAL